MNPFFIVALLCSVGGLLAGGGAVDMLRRADIAILKASQAAALADAEQLYRRRLADEQERGFALSDKLAKTETQLTQRTLEVSRALSKVTTGRACLGNDAVRLLNRAPRDDPTVPETAGPSVTEGGAVATDTDVAGWIGNAQWQYDTCRARLNTLIDFETGRPDDRTKQ